jgi:ABC-type sugar transport system permease subunit
VKMKMKMTLTKRRAVTGYMFILPFIIGFFSFYIVAIGMAAVYSFNDLHIVPGGYELEFVGWTNYINAMTKHTWYVRELVESFRDMAMNVPLILMFSFFCACLLNQKFRGRAVARLIFFLPVIMASGIIVKIDNVDMVNSTVLHNASQEGTMSGQLASAFDITELLLSTGLPAKIVNTLGSIMNQIYDIITDSGVQILVFLAALQSISPSLFEAAQIEGATAWESFWKITFPMLSPYILTCTVYSIVDFFGSFDNGVLEVISYTAETGNMELTYAMAMAMIYFVLSAIVVAIIVFALSKMVYYEDERR